MKSFSITIILLFTFITNQSSDAQSGWFWQNPLPQGNDLTNVQFVNSNTGFAVGRYGTILKTTNFGINWSFQNSGTNQYLFQVFMLSENTGYICGLESKLFITTNSGENWNYIQTNFDKIRSIYFFNENTGYASTAYGEVYYTSNAGGNWMNQLTLSNYNLNKIKFFNQNLGICVGMNQSQTAGIIIRTNNGGLNWDSVYNSLGSLYSIFFIDQDKIFVSGTKGQILKSVNSGLNWSAYSFNINDAINDITFLDNNTGIGVGSYLSNTRIYKTVNQGINWNYQDLPQYTGAISLTSVFGINTSTAICIGVAGIILKTTNSTNWINMSSGYYDNLQSLKFTDINTGYALAEIANSGGTRILRTTNSGNNWISIYLNTQYTSPRAIDFCNVNTGFYINENKVLKTTNGGVNWNLKLTAQTQINKLQFLDTNICYFIGEKVSKTTNGGNNWDTLNTGVSGPYFSLCFINSLTGFITAPYEKILKTTNGGLSFTTITQSSNNNQFTSIYFINQNTGSVISNPSLLLTTTSGGSNWIMFNTGSYTTGQDIHFINNVGMAIFNNSSTNCQIFKTTNYGITWTGYPTATDLQLYSIEMTSTETAYLSGTHGFILKTINGGVPFGIKLVNERIPISYYLHQNYPNPFNPSTKIEFDISKSEFVKLIIYDALGREIQSLVNENLMPGNYQIDFKSNDLSTGIYFYKLIVGDFSETRKMVLVK